MKRITTKRIFISIFAVILFALLITAQVTAQTTTIIACSDFQNPSGNTQGKQVVSGILSSMAKAGITSADGFLACGDYDYEYEETLEGTNALKEAVSGVVTGNMVFTQGNHDSAIGTDGLSSSGNNDPAGGEYGVFVINEDDYMWYNNKEDVIKDTTRNLIKYLNEKIDSGFEKPIFILSHLGLHYSMRTYYDGDAKHANYIFDVLNEAGEKGLNIIYLYGHDHSNGWDDYLGGSSVYLKKGDNILIAQNSSNFFESKKLAFTYMNAGYIGYYANVNGADDTLTMTAFKISDTDVTVNRYDANGIHNLKSAGVTNSYKGENAYQPDTTVYASPETITLTKINDKTPIVENFSKKAVEKYMRVTSLDELKDGENYLLVYNSTDDYIMIPQVVTISERTGYILEKTIGFGSDVVYGNYSDKTWKFTKTADKWLIGKDDEHAVLTYEASTGRIAATLEKEGGNEFVISGSADAYTFKSGSYVLNYNATRGLINGFTATPAEFYIYKSIPSAPPGLNLWTGTTEEFTFDKSTDLFDNEGVEYAGTVAGVDKDGKGDGIDPVDPTNRVVSLRQYGRTYPQSAVYNIEAERPVLLEFDYYSTNNENIYIWVNEYTTNTKYYYRFKSGEDGRELNTWNRDVKVIISDTGAVVNNVIVGCYASDWTYDLSIDNLSVIPYYKVTYNTNGGEGSAPADYFLANSFSDFDDGSGLVKAGYTFGGWSSELNGTAVTTVTPTPGSDITLYAVWVSETEEIPEIKTLDIASIMDDFTLEVQSIRFAGFVSDEYKATVDEIGFIAADASAFAQGDTAFEELKLNSAGDKTGTFTAANGTYNYNSVVAYAKNAEDKLYSSTGDGFGEESCGTGSYYAVAINNITSEHFDDDIVVKIYAKIGDQYVYGTAVTRSVNDVITASNVNVGNMSISTDDTDFSGWMNL